MVSICGSFNPLVVAAGVLGQDAAAHGSPAIVGLHPELDGEALVAAEFELVGIREKDVAGHLEHIRHSLQREGQKLRIVPAQCHGCGYRFTKRQRFKKPGRCPLCKGESIGV